MIVMELNEQEIPKCLNTYLFSNGMIMSFDSNDEQIGKLQGRDTPELRELIKANADEDISYHGFDGNACNWR